MAAPGKFGPLLLFAGPSLLTRLRRWGGLGLFLLGIIDSSIIPTLGSLDLLTAVLAVRHRDLWPYYAGMSTAGALIGAFITYRMGHRAGAAWLARRFGAGRLHHVQRVLQRWGFGAIFVSVLAPPPFPTSPFLLAAGALHYPARRYVGAVAAGRAIRYSAIAYIAARLSRQILRVLRRPHQYLWISLGLTVMIILATLTIVMVFRDKHPVEAAAADANDIPPPPGPIFENQQLRENFPPNL